MEYLLIIYFTDLNRPRLQFRTKSYPAFTYDCNLRTSLLTWGYPATSFKADEILGYTCEEIKPDTATVTA